MSLKIQIARSSVLEACLYAQKKGLVAGTWGNISCRVKEEDKIVITPSGVQYDKLQAEHIPIIDMFGHILDGDLKPSSEAALHLAIYNARPDVQAIVHTHSPYATAHAIARKPIEATCEDMVQVVGGRVDVAEYALPGTEELAKNVVWAIDQKQAALMANHGLVAIAETMNEALKVALICEKSAQSNLMAGLIGGAVVLSDEDCDVMRENYLTKYGQK